MENKSIIKGYLYAVMSATIYGLMPMMAKFIYADGVSSLCGSQTAAGLELRGRNTDLSGI